MNKDKHQSIKGFTKNFMSFCRTPISLELVKRRNMVTCYYLYNELYM